MYEPEVENFIALALPLKNNSRENKKAAAAVWSVDMGANIGFHSMHIWRSEIPK